MRILSWLKRRRLDEEDFREEIRAHLAIAAGEKIADGADPRGAELASLKEFGNVTLTTEAAHRVWTPRWLDALHDGVRDVRYALRGLARNPLFAFTVIAVLAVGIGVNATAFTMLKTFAISPLSGVDASAQLTVVYGETNTGRLVRLSYPDYQYLRDHDRAFSTLFGSANMSANLGRGRNARQVVAELVTGDYFRLLGVGAQRGRTLLPSDEIAPGRHPVAVISDTLWRRDFGADPDIVGRTVEINRYPLTVVGVADAAFHGTIVSYETELFIPVMMAAQVGVDGGLRPADVQNVLSDRRAMLIFPHGRLRPGTSLASAIAQTNAIWTTLSRDRPLTEAAARLRVVRFWQSPTGAQTYILPTIFVISAMGLLVLLVACANLAGLVLVRGVSRRGEIATRLALGATRWRIVRLLLLENVLLAIPGAALGNLVAWWGVPLMAGWAEAAAAPERVFFNSRIDVLVIGFSVLVACGSALVFGFLPALRTTRVDLVTAINEDASPRGASRGRVRAALVVAQVTVSLLLLVGSSLVTRSLDAARRVNPGFEPDHVTMVAIDLAQNGYDEVRGRVFYRRLLDRLRNDPGIESATLATTYPLNLVGTRAQRVTLDGYVPRRDEDLLFASNRIGPDYFRTLRIGVLAGRTFDDRDDETGAPVAMVNDTLARRYFGGASNAIGRRLRVSDGEWRTVVGVAADVKYSQIDEAPRAYVYLPLLQDYRSGAIVHTRGSAPIDRLLQQARAHIGALDPDLPFLTVRPLAERTAMALVFLNLAAKGLFLFGVVGMVLAAMGIYGLVSYTVKQSTHEIGIRMALGAHSVAVVRDFLGRGVRLGALGTAFGIVAALALTRLLGGLLYGVSATDPLSFAQALAIVLAGVVLATIVPAWRAARTSPLDALRHQ